MSERRIVVSSEARGRTGTAQPWLDESLPVQEKLEQQLSRTISTGWGSSRVLRAMLVKEASKRSA